MVRIIDMECSVPRGEGETSPATGTTGGGGAGQPAAYGMGNYGRIFRSRREGADHRPGIDLDAYVDMLAKLGIVRSVPFGVTNEETAALLRRYPDQFPMDFPELKIIGGLGGWPWVNEMVALVRRHPNLHVDTSAHRAKYLGQAGSGWEMLIQFGNTLIQDKVLVGMSAGLVGQPYETLIQEYLGLPLKDTVKEKWLYGNAARVFGLE